MHKNKILVLFLLPLFSVSCKSKIMTSKIRAKSDTVQSRENVRLDAEKEHLDLVHLFASRDTNTLDGKIFDVKSGENVFYRRIDQSNNSVSEISGSKREGFQKLTFFASSPNGKRVLYWPNGNVKLIETVYINYPYERDKYPQNLHLFKVFPVGISFKFDESEKLIDAIDNDKRFPFSLISVKEYLKKRGINFSNKGDFAVIDRYFNDKSCLWYLKFDEYTEKKASHLVVSLDGRTGKVLNERKMNYEY